MEKKNNLAVLFPRTIELLRLMDGLFTGGEDIPLSKRVKISLDDNSMPDVAFNVDATRFITVSHIHPNQNNSVKQQDFISFKDKGTMKGWNINYMGFKDQKNDTLLYSEVDFTKSEDKVLSNVTTEVDDMVYGLLVGYVNNIGN